MNSRKKDIFICYGCKFLCLTFDFDWIHSTTMKIYEKWLHKEKIDKLTVSKGNAYIVINDILFNV